MEKFYINKYSDLRFKAITGSVRYTYNRFWSLSLVFPILAHVKFNLKPKSPIFMVVWRPPTREYWMIYRRPGFIAVYDFFDPHPTTLPPAPVSKLERRHTGSLRKRDNLLTGEGGRGWGRSQIIRQRESLVLYKSFNILCPLLSLPPLPSGPCLLPYSVDCSDHRVHLGVEEK